MSLSLCNFTEQLDQLAKRHARELEALKGRSGVVAQANGLASQFEADHPDYELEVSVAVGYQTHESTAIDFRLTEGQHIELVKPLLKLVAQTRAFSPARETEYLAVGWTGWRFTPKAEGLKGDLLVRVWFGSSQVCRLEPTGEMKPVMKVVCEPTETINQGDANHG